MDPTSGAPANDTNARANTWAMFLHLSLMAGVLVPMGGMIVPIILWQLKKDEWPIIDQHGRNAVNWIITFVILAAISFLLVFVLIGIPMLWLLGLANVVFAIVAAVKAKDGVVWKYPLAVKFI